MVLYKRKQVTFVRPPSVPADLSTQIFVIPQTKEWFLEYEDYVNRMDYYHRRKFVCEITGNSCLTFFEAYESELKEIKDVERNFPEALREHILRFLQFNRITRLDQLVDKVYLVFKNEYFPGEDVYVKKALCTSSAPPMPHLDENGELLHTYVSAIKQKGTIREKVQYSNPSDTKYLVSTFGDGQQIIATNDHISRDRNHFTKWLIKTFVKLTVTRSHKVGAPWVVKEKYAKKYRIPQSYPEDLKHYESSTPSGEILYEEDVSTPAPQPELFDSPVPKPKKQRVRSLKKKATLNAAAAAMGSFEILLNDTPLKPYSKSDPRKRFPVHHLPPAVQKELELHDMSIQPSKKTIVDDLLLDFDLQRTRPVPSVLSLPDNAVHLQASIAKEVKPEEETKNEEENEREEDETLKITTSKEKVTVPPTISTTTLTSVQEALECWAFLNVYHTVLKLDTFTFDDFICAMGWNLEQVKTVGRCGLLDEIWCAVLGAIVSNEKDDDPDESDDEGIFGLQITMPSEISLINPVKVEADSNDDDTRGSDSELESKTLKIEDETSDVDSESGSSSPKANGTKAKKAESPDKKVKAEEVQDEDSETTPEPATHDAYSVIKYRGIKWHERLRRRNFKDGNWQVILLGLMSILDYLPQYGPIIEEVFKTLAPLLNQAATPATVMQHFYADMGIDLRLKTLHILTTLLINGTLVRTYIDESLEASTTLRRRRLDTIRDYKVNLDAATKAHAIIHEILVEASTRSTFTRKKQKLVTKGYEMTEYEKWLAENDELFKAQWEERERAVSKLKDFKKVKKEIELKLTESDCQRVRLLGKDRLFNRYWWFENNGLPNLHFSRDADDDEEDSVTDDEDDDDKDEVLEETYLMGKLWVQGPSAADLLVNLKLTKTEVYDTQFELKDIHTLKNDGSVEAAQEEGFDLEDGGPKLKVMNFQNLPSQYLKAASKFSLQFHSDFIIANGNIEVVDRLGGIPYATDVEDLSPIQRKFVEEAPEPLVSGTQWRYYDKPEDIDSLLEWLNPWGKRESILRKELAQVKDGLVSSMTARRKALWVDKLPKEEIEIESHISAVNSKIEQLKSGIVGELTEIEESDEDVVSRKRPHRGATRGANKRQKTMEETIKESNLEELEILLDKLKADVTQKKVDNQITRVLEWVNSTTKYNLDRSLYDGGDRAKPTGKKAKK